MKMKFDHQISYMNTKFNRNLTVFQMNNAHTWTDTTIPLCFHFKLFVQRTHNK